MENDEPEGEQKQPDKDATKGLPSVGRDSDNDQDSGRITANGEDDTNPSPKSAWTAPVIVQVIFDLLLVIATSTYAVFAIKQWKAMRDQVTQMQQSGAQTDRLICLYQQQLAQLTKQAGDTHELAVQAKNQADRTKDIASTALRQTKATEENLRAVIEPTCTIEQIGVGENITARCDFKNAGHSVAFKARGASDAKRWIDLPDGPMPVQIIEDGTNLAPDSESHVTYIDSLPATAEFLNGLPALTTNDAPGNETVFFFTRFEYSSLGQLHHTEVCFHLTKANTSTSTMPEAKTGYMLRQCRKWHSAD
jgi:hypothetical protein